jgi:hypothetical protein
MYERDHPPPLAPTHPWIDPLAPPSLFEPRPDLELTIAGPLAPRPQDFPFTDQGRHDYYEAVRQAAGAATLLQHQQIDQARAAAAAEAAHAAEEEAGRARTRTRLLLLGP